MGEMHMDKGVTTFVKIYPFVCYVGLVFVTCKLVFDKIIWRLRDPRQVVPTFGKFSERFLCKVAIGSFPENVVKRDLSSG